MLSPSVPETVSTRENIYQKSRRSWGANPWHPALQASALATRPLWIEYSWSNEASMKTQLYHYKDSYIKYYTQQDIECTWYV